MYKIFLGLLCVVGLVGCVGEEKIFSRDCRSAREHVRFNTTYTILNGFYSGKTITVENTNNTFWFYGTISDPEYYIKASVHAGNFLPECVE